MTFILSDGTEVEYRALGPADAAAAANAARDNHTMYVEVIRIAVLTPENVLEHLAGLPDQAEQIAQLGMTRDQVLVSLGYPATNRTPSLQGKEWTYWYNPNAQPWYNSWATYRVVFDDTGKVSEVVGRPAPTAELAIRNADAPPPSDTGEDQDSSKKSKKRKQK